MIAFKLLCVSKFGLASVCLSLVLAIIGRFLFPFGDEPDWSVRAVHIVFNEHSFWSPYLYFQESVATFSIDTSACRVEAGALNLWAYIPSYCNEPFVQSISRWLMTAFILTPLFVALIFRNFFVFNMHKMGCRLERIEWDRRLDSLALALLFPGMLYYLGVFAEEQFFLIIALYVFLFWRFWIPILIILSLLITIDFGNTIVTVFFISTLIFLGVLRNKFGRVSFFLVAFCMVLIALVFGITFLDLILRLSFLGDSSALIKKSAAIFDSLDGSVYLNNYPVVLRPIITFMTFVFMTPTGIKVPVLYVLYAVVFVIVSAKVIKSNSTKLDLYWFTPLTIIVFFVFLLPTYGNAKYYIFVLPFFIYVALEYFNKKNMAIVFLLSTFVVYLHLFLYRI